ncbi:MAG TPA: hypothetical protein DCR43_01600 [Bacteroidales bacterium]|nr:MAG: hypothetical protein A2X11_10650 [Bacteroidetes bacterium GWE2_42_24]OFY28137.1 MAG: hypothetical protein A2X09_00905 [Bacteroidetes bacterium GWF2_43_11]PKP15637.1 MAG: hypothetical protein CVU06_16175 [Bacteroidetes bacterium HGW-Bacteroidetes-22]HAQ64544.1 hypothetical protein [Bacteroidales bacterium]HBZ65519.1 hypothetical protein [Bacteroidales bacterium]
MKKNILKLIVIGALVAAPALIFAQPNPGENSGGTPVGGAPIGGGSAPLGGGIAILLAMGAGYGAKRVYKARKKLAE